MSECPICQHTSCESTPTEVHRGVLGTRYNCPRCGNFLLADALKSTLEGYLDNRTIIPSALSHHVRKIQREKRAPVAICEIDLNYLKGKAPPNPQEQIDNLLLWIGSNQASPDTYVISSPECIAAIVGAAVTPGTTEEPGFMWLLGQYGDDNDLFQRNIHVTDNRLHFRLKIKGWSTYQELRYRIIVSRRAFMAMKFGDQEMDAVFMKCFKPAVERTGFQLYALNEGQPAGLIDNQIRAAIRSARFVVADLTHDNNGAYFEAGFAEGLNLPVIYTCEKTKFDKKKTHFDTNHMVTVPWYINNLDHAGLMLTATIRATLPGEAKPEGD